MPQRESQPALHVRPLRSLPRCPSLSRCPRPHRHYPYLPLRLHHLHRGPRPPHLHPHLHLRYPLLHLSSCHSLMQTALFPFRNAAYRVRRDRRACDASQCACFCVRLPRHEIA
ncbi:hypothetical protein K503DRAFT_46328 [Rhizopogon vinicolor AM-OR11-026]|uniref:Uncharacterized protein n=1 Tax=Rhizopogon vinicolor AM-OR11-026 TaxID=1314800 RepID=A0A1B7MGV0_9AGAM|nr:hypothetical protein K503DRAFT_46328 [Rhizopogon vinicolor AM-OR11-026]